MYKKKYPLVVSLVDLQQNNNKISVVPIISFELLFVLYHENTQSKARFIIVVT